jgi:hypothetical protein
LQEFNGHYRYLCAELRKARRLAIIGTKTEAISVLKYDYFKLNYRSLVAFVEIDKNASGISDFCHLPRIRLEALADVRLDTVLIVDDPFGNAELKVRNFYLKKNLQLPRILLLVPDEKRPFAPLVKFIRRHSAATSLDKILVLSVIQIPLLIADTKAWFLTMLKSHYEALNKNTFTRRLLEKVRR